LQPVVAAFGDLQVPRKQLLEAPLNSRMILHYLQGQVKLFVLAAGGSEKARIDSSGRLLVGTSTSRDNWFNGSGQSPVIQSESSSSQNFFSGTYTSSGAGAAIALLGKARGTSYQVVSNADGLGRISFQGADGAQMVEAAFILAEVDGTPGANDMPGRLVFSTTADGASSPTERLRITSAGNVGIGTTSPGALLHAAGKIRFGSNATYYGEIDHDAASTGSNIYNSQDSGGHIFQVSGSEKARIDSSGRLGIGTSSPTTGKLTLVSDIDPGTTAAGIAVSLSGIGWRNRNRPIRHQSYRHRLQQLNKRIWRSQCINTATYQ
jgi:hypothetical protein